jgi:hypothetical protein
MGAKRQRECYLGKPMKGRHYHTSYDVQLSVGQLRGGGGVNQLLPCLNNYASFKLFAETLNDDHINAGK